jgi:hypothetical protein
VAADCERVEFPPNPARQSPGPAGAGHLAVNLPVGRPRPDRRTAASGDARARLLLVAWFRRPAPMTAMSASPGSATPTPG